MDRDDVRGGHREPDLDPQDAALVDLLNVACRRIEEQGGRRDDDGPSGGRVGTEGAEKLVRRHDLGELVEVVLGAVSCKVRMSFSASFWAFLTFFLPLLCS